MRVAVYTLTRERLDFTKHTFALLRERAGVPFDHYVIDNTGLQGGDDTRAWLTEEKRAGRLHRLHLMDENVGISIGSNHALAQIAREPGPAYDVVAKFDNDCEPVTDGFLAMCVKYIADASAARVPVAVSPRVVGIGGQPTRWCYREDFGMTFGETGLIGGLCHVVPWSVYRWYRYPEHLPFARGQDGAFCETLVREGVRVGYLEGVEVGHYLTTGGQERTLPDYFKRKYTEEAIGPWTPKRTGS